MTKTPHLPYQLTVLKHNRPRPHACSGVTDTVGHFTFTLYDSQVVGGHETVSCLLSHWGWSSRALRCTTQRWQVRLTWFSRGRLICLADCNANRHVSAGTRVWQFWVFLVIAWGNKASLCNEATGVLQREKKRSKTAMLVLELLLADPNIQLLAIQLFQFQLQSTHQGGHCQPLEPLAWDNACTSSPSPVSPLSSSSSAEPDKVHPWLYCLFWLLKSHKSLHPNGQQLFN